MGHRLYRCQSNRVLAGVAGGVAEFFGLNPTHVRILWVIAALFGGFSIVLYVALALMVELEPIAGQHPPMTDTRPDPHAA